MYPSTNVRYNIVYNVNPIIYNKPITHADMNSLTTPPVIGSAVDVHHIFQVAAEIINSTGGAILVVSAFVALINR